MATYTKKDIELRIGVLEKLLDLGKNVKLGIYGAYGKTRIEAYTRDNYRHIEDLTHLGTKREVYEEIGVAINVLRLYKKRVEIRKKYKTGNYYHKDLAKTYGVSRSLISLVLSKKIWSHIQGG